MSDTPTAAIVVIGNEILSGKFADQNATFLIAQLRALGVALRRIEVIPDHVDDIATTVPRLAARHTHVFTSGGVGPTHDDVTMAGIARGFATEVVRQPTLAALLRQHFGEHASDAMLRLANVPKGAALVYGDNPDWPVIAYDNVYILPGVPSLFARKFSEISERFRVAPFCVGRIYCMADESTIADAIAGAARAHSGVMFGSYPRFDEVEYRVLVTIESKDVAAARTATLALSQHLGQVVIRVDAPDDPAPPG